MPMNWRCRCASCPLQKKMCPVTGLDPDAIVWSIPPALQKAADEAALEGDQQMPVERIWARQHTVAQGRTRIPWACTA